VIEKVFKILCFTVLGVYGIVGAFRPELFSLLNGANILFHEAGHLLFSFFGEYLMIWGGTLLQLLFPLGLALGFITKQQPASAAVMAWWFGQNFFGISAYIKDARAQILPFIGGEQHDWEYILRFHKVLDYDQGVGNAAWWLGFILMTAAVIYGIRTVVTQKGGGDDLRSH
jgi:hypothetical protein